VHGQHIIEMVQAIEDVSVGLSAPNDPGCHKVRAELQTHLKRLSDEQRARGRAFDRVEMGDGGNVTAWCWGCSTGADAPLAAAPVPSHAGSALHPVRAAGNRLAASRLLPSPSSGPESGLRMTVRIATFNAENLLSRFDFSGFRNELGRTGCRSFTIFHSEEQYHQAEIARASR
jgi:hypothetical protein